MIQGELWEGWESFKDRVGWGWGRNLRVVRARIRKESESERGYWKNLETRLIKQSICPFNIIHLPVLFFLFPGSCAFQNVLLYLGRCDVPGSSNYLGLSKVAVPKSKTNF